MPPKDNIYVKAVFHKLPNSRNIISIAPDQRNDIFVLVGLRICISSHSRHKTSIDFLFPVLDVAIFYDHFKTSTSRHLPKTIIWRRARTEQYSPLDLARVIASNKIMQITKIN